MALKTELRKAGSLLTKIVLGPIYFLPSLLLKAFHVEFVWTRLPDRIGHLCVDIDSYLKEMKLGRRPFARPVYLQGLKPPANPTMLDYWGRYILLIKNPLLSALLHPFMMFPYLVADLREYATVRLRAARMSASYAAWDKRPALLELTPEHIARGEAVLRKLGVPEGAWFVCLHSRDRGYAVHDDDINDYRNCSIETYLLAADEIVARGGYCIRVGDKTAAHFAPRKGVIDYAHSEFVTDWMDIFLCAHCRFYLGNGSGLFAVSTVFGVPTALAHLTPMEAPYVWTPFDVTTPKLVADKNGKPMSFRAVLDSPIASFRFTPEFTAAGITHIDNTAEEVRDLAREMIERLEGRAVYTAEDERLQDTFRSFMKPHHYCYGAAGRIGRDFLRAHADLMK